MSNKHAVVLTGAGISAESGLRTFRDSDGLWENHRLEDVATPEAWARDPEMVLRFYNERRRGVVAAQPNAAHRALAALEAGYDVTVITQNIDDLHERAGSSRVLHLHGEILKARSSADESLLYDTGGEDIRIGDTCEKGSQLRPHVVWFGEAVPMIVEAARVAATADLFLVVGTSLTVYPAAGLIRHAPPSARCFLVDPKALPVRFPGVTLLMETATSGVPKLVQQLLEEGA
ncbi:MAG: NAD-dependent deacylase [Planctomycetota bacterium]